MHATVPDLEKQLEAAEQVRGCLDLFVFWCFRILAPVRVVFGTMSYM